jgi:hypothetical protein
MPERGIVVVFAALNGSDFDSEPRKKAGNAEAPHGADTS